MSINIGFECGRTGFLRSVGLALLLCPTWGLPTSAQSAPIRGQVIVPPANRTVINNTYYAGSYGYGRPSYNYSCVGCFPGGGPYDSAVAVAGIAAGASVINNIINSATIARQPQVVINQGYPAMAYQSPLVDRQPAVTVRTPGIVQVQNPPYQAPPGCSAYITGQSPAGGPTYVTVCQ
jgi:hypothetical protein